jgi:hypothetical protein
MYMPLTRGEKAIWDYLEKIIEEGDEEEEFRFETDLSRHRHHWSLLGCPLRTIVVDTYVAPPPPLPRAPGLGTIVVYKPRKTTTPEQYPMELLESLVGGKSIGTRFGDKKKSGSSELPYNTCITFYATRPHLIVVSEL